MRDLKVQKMKSFDAAMTAEMDYYLSLTPQERMRIASELIALFFHPIEEMPDIREVEPKKLLQYSSTSDEICT